MEKEENRQLIKELLLFEKEEEDLISLYKILGQIDIIHGLPKENGKQYMQSLEKLLQDSKKHLKAMKDLLKKYKN